MKIATIGIGVIFLLYGLLSLMDGSLKKEKTGINNLFFKRFVQFSVMAWNTIVPVFFGVVFIIAGIKEIPILHAIIDYCLEVVEGIAPRD